MLANQVRFTAPTKHITGGLDSAIAVTGVGSVGGNDMGSGGGVGVVPIAEIDMSSGSDYGVSSSVEVHAGVDLEDTEVCLQYQPQQ